MKKLLILSLILQAAFCFGQNKHLVFRDKAVSSLLNWWESGMPEDKIDKLSHEPAHQIMEKLYHRNGNDTTSFAAALTSFQTKGVNSNEGYGIQNAFSKRKELKQLLVEIEKAQFLDSLFVRVLNFFPKGFQPSAQYEVFLTFTGWEYGDAMQFTYRMDQNDIRLVSDGTPAIILNLTQIHNSYGNTLEERMSTLSDVLAHEVFHAMLEDYSSNNWKQQDNPKLGETFNHYILNEGIAHYISEQKEFHLNYPSDDFREKEKRSFQLYQKKAPLIWDEQLGKEERIDIFRSGLSGKFWEKFIAITGMFMAYHIEQELGLKKLQECVKYGPNYFLLSYLSTEKAKEEGFSIPTANDFQAELQLQVRDYFRKGRIRNGQKILKQLLQFDAANSESHYLYAEAALLKAEPDFWKHKEFVQKYGTREQQVVLETKFDLFLGTGQKEEMISQSLQEFSQNHELQLCKWLNELEKGNWKKCYKRLEQIDHCLFSFQPYKALYYNSCVENKKLAKSIRQKCTKNTNYTINSKFVPLLDLPDKKFLSQSESIELPFAWYGPYLGVELQGKDGTVCKLELDTGTGYDLITLHTLEKGEKLAGKDTICIKNGIQYNSMDQAEDMHYKLANYLQPACSNVTTGYFKGSIHGCDGCISPTAFRPYAMHIDPIREKIYLRSPKNMKRLRKREKGNYFSVPYVERGGWIFIPCKINGQEVLMLVETGSGNVNLNNYSLKKAGLKSYKETIQWKGKDYPVDKVDFTLELGEMKYEVEGGITNDWVMANLNYGLASAGDLGPDFFRHFPFIIDPYKKELIIFRENNELIK
ncbi:MAG: DUF5700 domain-containing putative Zn-dependent protease [Marinifilaceae bacterium]